MNLKVEAPVFSEFLDIIFDGDTEKVRELRDYMGLCMASNLSIGPRIIVFQGPYACGKTLCSNIIKACVGFGQWGDYLIHKFSGRNAGLNAYQLLGKNVNIIHEVLTDFPDLFIQMVLQNRVVCRESMKSDYEMLEVVSTRHIIESDKELNLPEEVRPCAAVLRFAANACHRLTTFKSYRIIIHEEIEAVRRWVYLGFADLLSMEVSE